MRNLADLIKAARISLKNAKRFSGYKHTPTNTRASLLQYYSQIPLKWIDRLGQIYNASFKMIGYNFPGPLKSLYENDRMQSPIQEYSTDPLDRKPARQVAITLAGKY